MKNISFTLKSILCIYIHNIHITIIILFTYLKIHEVLEGYNLISADVFAVIVCIIVISMPRAY